MQFSSGLLSPVFFSSASRASAKPPPTHTHTQRKMQDLLWASVAVHRYYALSRNFESFFPTRLLLLPLLRLRLSHSLSLSLFLCCSFFILLSSSAPAVRSCGSVINGGARGERKSPRAFFGGRGGGWGQRYSSSSSWLFKIRRAVVSDEGVKRLMHAACNAAYLDREREKLNERVFRYYARDFLFMPAGVVEKRRVQCLIYCVWGLCFLKGWVS